MVIKMDCTPVKLLFFCPIHGQCIREMTYPAIIASINDIKNDKKLRPFRILKRSSYKHDNS